MKKRSAFTFAELMVAVALLSVGFVLAVQSTYAGNVFIFKNARKIELQQSARHMLNSIEKDIRNADHNVVSTTIDQAGDSFVVSSPDGNFEYGLVQGNEQGFILQRNSRDIGINVNKVHLSTHGRTVFVTVDVMSYGLFGGVSNFQVTETVRSRNG